MSTRVRSRLRNVASVLAGLALFGLACGRTVLDQPVGADDGAGGALSSGGASGIGGAGVGGASAGGAPGAGGSPGMGGNVGTSAGGTTGSLPCNQITDEMTCLARGAACRADYCRKCFNVFVGCANPGDPMTVCPLLPPCVPP